MYISCVIYFVVFVLFAGMKINIKGQKLNIIEEIQAKSCDVYADKKGVLRLLPVLTEMLGLLYVTHRDYSEGYIGDFDYE